MRILGEEFPIIVEGEEGTNWPDLLLNLLLFMQSQHAEAAQEANHGGAMGEDEGARDQPGTPSSASGLRNELFFLKYHLHYRLLHKKNKLKKFVTN